MGKERSPRDEQILSALKWLASATPMSLWSSNLAMLSSSIQTSSTLLPRISTMRRYSMIIAYNQRINNPLKDHHHASYNPLVKVEDSALMECTTMKSTIEKTYFDPSEDLSIKKSG